MLFEFWKAGDVSEEETKEAYEKAMQMVEDTEFKSTLNQPEDELPAVLQINSGAGGTERFNTPNGLAVDAGGNVESRRCGERRRSRGILSARVCSAQTVTGCGRGGCVGCLASSRRLCGGR